MARFSIEERRRCLEGRQRRAILGVKVAGQRSAGFGEAGKFLRAEKLSRACIFSRDCSDFRKGAQKTALNPCLIYPFFLI